VANVLVVGEALVDVLSTGGHRARRPGGSPANVAVGLARLGVRTTLLTCFADDADGRLLSEHLAAAGVEVLRSPAAATSTALATIGRDGQATYEFALSWDIAVATDLAPHHLHLGSFSATKEPGCEQVLELARRATGLVTYDLNCRPAVMGSPAQVLPRMERLIPLAGVVKLSDEDAQWLYGPQALYGDGDVFARLHELGAPAVVLTRGADGCVASTGAERYAVPAAPGGLVVDTVGAGDAFMAGLIAQLLAEVDLPDALAFASVVARRTCERAGADPPTLAELA
jgi:fructokinase